MISRQNSRRAVIAIVLLGTLLGSGCVVVVGGEGNHRRADVEWSSSSDDRNYAEPGRQDDALTRELQSRIRADAALAAEDISVSSSGSVVTLHGRVGALAALEQAMQLAADVPGVTRVVSRLTVELEGS
jgi:hypothetical protein